MIYDFERRPKGITIVKLPAAGAQVRAQPNLADVIPLLDAGSADARHWRPDVTENQSWSFPTTIAASPLASGVSAANHKRREPVTLSFDAAVTDTPFVPFGRFGGPLGERRADALLAALYALNESRDFVAVIAPVRTISTAIIESLTLNRTASDGSAYFVTIQVTEARVYDLQLLSSIDDAAAQLGAARTTAGGIVIG